MKKRELTELERYKIEILLGEKIPVKAIAKKLERHESTIYKEIKHGTVELIDSQLIPYKKYCADVAQAAHDKRQLEKGRPLKVGNDLRFIKYCEKMIKEYKWSPDAVIGHLKVSANEFETSICTKTLYNYIDNNVLLNVTNADLPIKRVKKRKYNKVRTVALKNLKGLSIEQRPETITERMEFGHWELDTVVSGHKHDGKASLLVFTERKTRDELVFKMKNRTQKETIKIINSIERRYTARGFREIFKSITVDNGTEFLDWQSIEKSISTKMPRTKVYFCHPFSSYERGSNENQNKLIRRWIPKGSNIGKYTDKEIQFIQDWINNYPRKIFSYRTSKDMIRLEALPVSL